MTDSTLFSRLPDELIENIVFHLPPPSTLNFGSTCRRANTIASEHLVWRRHCLSTWRYWHPKHEIEEKKEQPPAQVRWRQLFDARRLIDKEATETLDALLQTQQHRVARCEQITDNGYDVKDVLQTIRNTTPDDHPYVLARRYYADALLGQLHRRTGVDKWRRLAQQQMVRLEEVLGAYDLFVLDDGRQGDLEDLNAEFERLANAVRDTREDFEHLSTREKAVEVARYLRAQNLVGNAIEAEYHNLRNNFLSIALFEMPHTSLPLQSVAIYCAVARRLGINAKPSNYPHHVHAVVMAPPDATLDGLPRSASTNNSNNTHELSAADWASAATTTGNDTDGEDSDAEGLLSEAETMHMDPWRSDAEVSRSALTTRLAQMGAQPAQHAGFLGAASTLEIALRTGRNIMNSVQEARNRQRLSPSHRKKARPDVEAAWYGMLWAMMVLGDSGGNIGATLHRRRQCLPYLVEHFQAHFPEDLGLIEKFIAPLFASEREHLVLFQLVTAARAADRNAKAPSPRDSPAAKKVKFPVGQFFQHKRYTYEGFVVGWDVNCQAEDRWIAQMRVDELPRGREQPFYNIVAEDKSVRYVAEENIHPLSIPPGENILAMAGRYFKRWDDERAVFVSNIQDEYPDN